MTMTGIGNWHDSLKHAQASSDDHTAVFDEVTITWRCKVCGVEVHPLALEEASLDMCQCGDSRLLHSAGPCEKIDCNCEWFQRAAREW